METDSKPDPLSPLREAFKLTEQLNHAAGCAVARSQHCELGDHKHCPRETTLGTKPCECECHKVRRAR